MRARAALAGACLLLAGGCAGGDDRPAREPGPLPAEGSGYFVGEGPRGIGATVDLQGEDAITAAVAAALAAGDPAVRGATVGVASVVNDGPRPLPAPAFVATFEGGGAAPLQDAASVLARAGGPAARRALALLGPPPRAVRAGGAVTMYVVLRGASAAEVEAVGMTTVPGTRVTMPARRR